MRVLGIETSCDETGIAIYDDQAGLIAHAIYSQTDIHAPFGGVVPEFASRDHLRKTLPLVAEVLESAGVRPGSSEQVAGRRPSVERRPALDGIAYTKGPGLVGALLVGAMVARTLAYAWNIPALGVHHLEAHIFAPFLEPHPPAFPFLALLVSGGAYRIN